jgi:hypothetical protein
MNYKAYYDLSLFRLLFRGNIPTSSGLILKMNKYYKVRAESSMSSCGKRRKLISYPLPEG